MLLYFLAEGLAIHPGTGVTMSHLKAVIIICITAAAILTGCGNESSATSSTTVTQTSTTTVTAPNSLPVLREGNEPRDETIFVTCDGRSARATELTSCPFSREMARVYDGTNLVYPQVHSPQTGRDYNMQCVTGFTAVFKDGSKRSAVRCTGGNNAAAIVFTS